MSDYKGPFTWAWTMDERRVVVDHDGNAVPLKTVLEILNAHARQSAQRCETCRHNDPKQTRSMGMTFDTPWCHRWNMWRPFEVNGCTAHQPKEQA